MNTERSHESFSVAFSYVTPTNMRSSAPSAIVLVMAPPRSLYHFCVPSAETAYTVPWLLP